MMRCLTCCILGVLLTACAPSTSESVRAKEEIQRIFELSTVEMVFRDVIYHSAEDRLFNVGLPWSKKEVLFAVDFRVRAGFDLGGGYELRPSADRKTLEIELPGPQILLVDADDQSIEEYLTDGRPLGYVRLQSLLEARTDDIRRDALRLGILERARLQARVFLENFFLSLGYDTVNLKFRPTPEVKNVP